MSREKETFIEDLYRAESLKLLEYAKRRVRNSSLAQDLVQDTFHEAVRHEAKLFEHPNPEGWLLLTLKNKILSFNRNYARYTKRFVSCEDISTLPAEPESDAEELLNEIREVLGPEEYYLFKRLIIDECGHFVAAAELGITVWASQKRLSRIREKLEKQFPEYAKNRKIIKIMCQLFMLAAIY